MGVIAENRPADDVLDVLGFVTSEMVKRVTAEAMAVQAGEGRGVEAAPASKQTAVEGPFGSRVGGREAIGPRHVRIAFQRLQAVPKRRRALLAGTRIPGREGLQLVSVSPAGGLYSLLILLADMRDLEQMRAGDAYTVTWISRVIEAGHFIVTGSGFGIYRNIRQSTSTALVEVTDNDLLGSSLPFGRISAKQYILLAYAIGRLVKVLAHLGSSERRDQG